MKNNIRPIAIHLPQFHPIPENDNWWGKGFTEWTNVTKAKPRFEGHYQPHLPADLGFYDLRLAEARLEQEKMAKEYGIFGFCYYHYWFNGKRLLNEPVDRKLKNPEEDLPFMLCWANENWTRAWDGGESNLLLQQNYDNEDDRNHMEILCENYFKDERYIKVDGKPVFLIYRPNLFPNIVKTNNLWRKVVKEKGFPDLYLGYVKSFGVDEEPKSMGFDFAIEFHPKIGRPSKVLHSNKILNKFLHLFHKYKKTNFDDIVWDYNEYVDYQLTKGYTSCTFPTVMPGWDNSSRRKQKAFILENSTPEKYGYWLKSVIKNYSWGEEEEDFLFINAWNEWAEGNHLEPCQMWGTRYLEETKKALQV